VQLGDSYPRLAQKMAAYGIRRVGIYDKHQRVLRNVCVESVL